MRRIEGREARRLAARLMPAISELNPAGVDADIADDEYGHLASQLAYRALGVSVESAVEWFVGELVSNWGFDHESAAGAGEVVRRALSTGD